MRAAEVRGARGVTPAVVAFCVQASYGFNINWRHGDPCVSSLDAYGTQTDLCLAGEMLAVLRPFVPVPHVAAQLSHAVLWIPENETFS